MKFRIQITTLIVAIALSLSLLSFGQSAHAAPVQAAKASTHAAAASPNFSTYPIQVQKIAVVNNAGFVMNFSVGSQNANGSSSFSATTDTFPIDQYRTIDVASEGLATGTTIWPHVNATAGNTQDGPSVQYAANGQVATFSVQGTTTSYTITLIGQ